MGKRGPKPRDPATIEWSPRLAYAVGLIATDGCLSGDGRHITLTSKDKEQIITFRSCLGLERIKIGKYASGRSGQGGRKDCLRLQFGDVGFYRWLLGIGLTPNKSKTIGPLKIPDRYFFDFFRGCFDGDGCIYGYWDPRWRSSYMYYCGIASASPVFLRWLQEVIERFVGVRGKISRAGGGTQQLRFAKAGTKVILKKMYHTKDAPYLKRKFVKAEKILTIDKQHNQNAQVAELVYAYA